MLFRFSLYGFLKNQTYFEPFLILAFREKGLSFFQIGLLIGFREVCVNLFEVPSGVVADLYGRRRAMIFSFLAYIASFLLFGFAASLAALFAAMFAFALGEAFRSGTHKAMIFDWLRREGRESERTRVYGFTRSWSKMGSALAVVISSAFIFSGAGYSDVFFLAAIPYCLGIVNFLGYPAELDGERGGEVGMGQVAAHLRDALRQVFTLPPLRRIVAESMSFEGTYRVTKDYIQPVIQQAALGLAVLAAWEGQQRVAVLVGGVYFVLHLLSSAASRGGHRLSEAAGSEERAARYLWGGTAALYALLLGGLWTGREALVIAAFLGLAAAQNFWRPILISRIDAHGSPEAGATVLSIEAQAKSFFAMLLAPAVGFAVDRLGLMPVGAGGLVVALPVAVRGFFQGQRSRAPAPQP
ncbi:MAG: MFS transporter [bacterium]